MHLRPRFLFAWLIGSLLSLHALGQRKETLAPSDSSDYHIWKLKINSSFNDYCPIIYKKGIVFSSDEETEFGIRHYDAKTHKPLLNIYYSQLTDSFKLSNPENFSKKINSPYHDGPASFSSDEQTIYFTSSGRPEQKRNLSIYVSHFIDDEWQEPVQVKLGHASYSVAHPALSANGQRLYFVSDMPGGYGGTDIYKSILTNGQWGPPINLGPDINTAGDERFPFLDKNGQLFFSSNGKNGLGKLDIYSAKKRIDKTYEVANMGSPINSPADDFGFSCDSTGMRGFFSSNRGGTDDNMYGYYRIEPKLCNCDTVRKNNYCFTFFEENSLMSKDTAGMTYEWDFGDATKAKGLTVDHCFRGPGKYFVQLNIIDSRTGSLFFNQSSYNFSVEDLQQLYMDIPDTVLVDQPQQLDASDSWVDGYQIKSYFWNFEGSYFRKGMQTEYTFSRTGRQNVMLGVTAVNKATGAVRSFCAIKTIGVVTKNELKTFRNKEPFNPGRNNHRVDTTLNIIPTHDSITYKVHLGSSKTKIPVTSKMFEGLKDIQEMNDNGIYRYTSGEAKKLLNSLPYFYAAKEKGFESAVVVAFENDKLIGHQEAGLKGEIVNPKTKNGTEPTSSSDNTTKVTPNEKSKVDSSEVKAYTLLFKVNQYALTENMKPLLDSVSFEAKKYDYLKVEILARTDNSGDPDYNLWLSKQRALSIRSYMIAMGVQAKRLQVIAYGDSRPVAENITETGKQANRRADIIIHP